MRKAFLIIAALLTVLTAAAQNRGKVTFALLDSESKQGVMGAVIEVYPTSKPDDKKYFTSGAGGQVSFSVAYGDYTLVAQFLGYDDLTQTFKVAKENVSLGKLYISEGATRIDTVVKEVQQFRTSQNADTLAYNASAFKVAADADVEGLLKKMPGITIQNGNVEAQGETIKKIFVDGKEFFGEDVNSAIKSLPAEAVDKVEVFNKLSDQAEFSGMDDGEGYKAINIVTKTNMRQGQFGKIYAGIGYQPHADESTFNPKYTAGGNVNFFQGDSRVSLIALFNNINQQNFSFEDILGVSGGSGQGGGRRGGGVGDYMVRPQSGVALVNSIGLNYTDEWGRKKSVKFQGSYFFNNTSTKDYSTNRTWYEDPSPYGTDYSESFSSRTNNNHRLNARLDWKISRNQSLMSRTWLSYQGHKPVTEKNGYTNADTELLTDAERALLPADRFMGISYTTGASNNYSYGTNIGQFLQYRVKLGKPGRTLSLGGRFNYSSNNSTRRPTSNDAPAVPYTDPQYQTLYDTYFGPGCDWRDMINDPKLTNIIYQYIYAPSSQYGINGSVQYNEPISTSSQFSFQYRFNYNKQEKDQNAWYTAADFDHEGPGATVNNAMTLNSYSGYWTHRIGPGFRFNQDKNRFVVNLFYQRSVLDGMIKNGNGQSDRIESKSFNNFTYFGMVNIAFNSENSIRMFFRSGTNEPSISQLQSIFDVSTPQYLSVGNIALIPSFQHRIHFHYINSNMEKGRTFMWMFMMSHQQDYISQSTLYNSHGWELPDMFGNIEIPKDQYGHRYKPTSLTSYENMDGYWQLRTHLSYGLPVNFMKCNLNLMAGVSYTITPSAIYRSGATQADLLTNMVNHVFDTNKAKNIGYDASVTLGSNISEKIDFTVQWSGTYNQAWNTMARGAGGKNAKNNYFSHVASGNLKWVFGKDFTLTLAMSYTQYVGFTTDYNEDFFLCNVYLGKKVFKNRRGEVQIGVNDAFNQNKGFTRNTGSGYTQNLTNSVIGRYFSVQFVYNLRHFGKKGTKQMNDYDYNESKASVGMGNANAGTRWRH